MQRKRKRGMALTKTPLAEMISHTRNKVKYKQLHKHLRALNDLVGMEKLKEAVVAQIQFILTNNGKLDEHYLNTVLQGPPGCGKTTAAEVLFNIWMALDIFQQDTEFAIIHRSDMVGTYMGHTANKTKKLLDKLSGSVIFIDEAYSLVNGEKDDYGKEALDEVNAFLSEEKGKTVVILAGYEKELNERIFQSNPGLRRRFGWTFNIDPYTADELYTIFLTQLKKFKWTCDPNVKSLFHTHFEKFKNAGGDTENIAFKAKLEYAKENWDRRRQTRCLRKYHVEKAMLQTLSNQDNDTYVNMYM